MIFKECAHINQKQEDQRAIWIFRAVLLSEEARGLGPESWPSGTGEDRSEARS
ncbi:MAG: hypothetical protein JW999_10990 [Methanotrichaceae archaeon]|nr:hypothetical protein [Methanotrichaceae archaeon]